MPRIWRVSGAILKVGSTLSLANKTRFYRYLSNNLLEPSHEPPCDTLQVPDPFVVVELMNAGPPVMARSSTVKKEQSPKFEDGEMVTTASLLALKGVPSNLSNLV